MADENTKPGEEGMDPHRPPRLIKWTRSLMEAGAGAPSGVVEGSKADGCELEIESNGKPIHKNSDAANPAVHVARQPGKDVAKRASKLTKLQSAAESSEAEEGGGGKNRAAVQGEKGGEEKDRKSVV